jgi:hypothetical protein
MSGRPAFRPQVGDRTTLSGELYEVRFVYPVGHRDHGQVRLQHVASPWNVVIVHVDSLTVLGFDPFLEGES